MRVGNVLMMVVILSSVLFCSACSHLYPQRIVKLSKHDATKSKDKVTGFSTPAELRLAFLREEDSRAVYCSEPIPDVALGSNLAASGSVSASSSLSQAADASMAASLARENEDLRNQLKEAVESYESETRKKYTSTRSGSFSSSISSGNEVNLQAAYKLAVTASELGGRSQQVLLAREFLYRLCEARANRFFVDDQAFIELQNNALKMVESISSPPKPTDSAQRVDELKQVIAYNEQQAKMCEYKMKSCKDAAKDEADKIKICVTNNANCVNAIKVATVSDQESAAKGKSALTDPKAKQLVPPEEK